MATRRQISIFINGREVATQIKPLTDEKQKIVRELRRMTIGTEEYKKKMKELDQINPIINKHNQGLRGVGTSYDKITAGAGRLLGVAGIAFSVDRIVGYGKELYKSGVQMDALGKKANTVLGPALAFVQEQAEKNAKQAGLTTLQYVDQSAALADLIKPYGIASEQAAQYSIQTNRLAGALSEWTGGQFSAIEVNGSFRKAILGSREELERYGIEIKESELQNRITEKGLAGLSGKLKKQAEILTTLELLTEKSADALQSYDNNAGSLVRTQAELQATFSSIKEEMAQALIPAFRDLLSSVQPVIEEVGKKLPAIIQGAIEWIKNIVNFLQEWATTIKIVSSAIIAYITVQKLSSAATAAWAAATVAYNTIVGVMTGEIKLATAAQRLWNIAMSANPIGLALAAITAVVFAVKAYSENTTASARATNKLKEATQDINREYATEKVRVDEIFRALRDVNTPQEKRNKLIAELKTLYPDYIGNIDTEKVNIEELDIAQQNLNKSILNGIVARKKSEAVADVYTGILDKQLRINELAEGAAITLAESAKARKGGDLGLFDTKGTQLKAIENYKAEIIDLEKEIENINILFDNAFSSGPKSKKSRGIGDSGKTKTEDSPSTEEEILAAAAAAETLRKERQKAAEKEIEDLKKKLEKLRELTLEAHQKDSFDNLAAETQEREKIRQKFEEQIALAKEIEAKGFTEATALRLELEKLRFEQVETLRAEQAQAATDADLAREEANQEEENIRYLEELGKKEEAKALIAETLRTEQEQELIDLELHYLNLLSLAEQYGIDTTSLRQKYAEEKAKINAKGNEKELKQSMDLAKAQEEIEIAKLNLLQTLAGQFSAIAGENATVQAALFFFDKVLAASSVIIQLQAQLAAIRLKYALIPGGVALAAVEGTKARIDAGISLATIAGTSIAKFAQRKEGGYFNVTGADDGMGYRAKYIGQPQTGMLPDGPVLTASGVLANERGREYFVANHDLANPAVANYVSMIENIRRNRVTQRAEGGFAAAAAPGTTTTNAAQRNTVDTQMLAALAKEISRLNNNLERGITATVDDDEVVNVFRKFNRLNEASGGTLS